MKKAEKIIHLLSNSRQDFKSLEKVDNPNTAYYLSRILERENKILELLLDSDCK